MIPFATIFFSTAVIMSPLKTRSLPFPPRAFIGCCADFLISLVPLLEHLSISSLLRDSRPRANPDFLITPHMQ